MAIGYLFIMFPILSLAIILFLLIAIALTIVFSVLGYSNYLKEQEKNILLIKNIYIISMLLGSFYFVSMFFKNVEIDLFILMFFFGYRHCDTQYVKKPSYLHGFIYEKRSFCQNGFSDRRTVKSSHPVDFLLRKRSLRTFQ